MWQFAPRKKEQSAPMHCNEQYAHLDFFFKSSFYIVKPRTRIVWNCNVYCFNYFSKWARNFYITLHYRFLTWPKQKPQLSANKHGWMDG